MKSVDVILPRVSIEDRTSHVAITRVDGDDRVEASDRVAVERGLEVRLGDEPFAVIMRTPGSDSDLAAGFLFSEGVVAERADIEEVVSASPDIVVVRLARDAADRAARNADKRRRVAMNSSCGMCGSSSLEALSVSAPVVEARWTIARAVLASLPGALADRQVAFRETGGLHAAAIAAPDGVVIDSAEDVGRHNAVDKVVGRAFVARRLPLRDHVLFVSGRTSFEIVQKAWLAGVPVVAAVSAPSSLAIELAEAAGITLVGFVRGRRFNIYTAGHRIVG